MAKQSFTAKGQPMLVTMRCECGYSTESMSQIWEHMLVTNHVKIACEFEPLPKGTKPQQ